MWKAKKLFVFCLVVLMVFAFNVPSFAKGAKGKAKKTEETKAAPSARNLKGSEEGGGEEVDKDKAKRGREEAERKAKEAEREYKKGEHEWEKINPIEREVKKGERWEAKEEKKAIEKVTEHKGTPKPAPNKR